MTTQEFVNIANENFITNGKFQSKWTKNNWERLRVEFPDWLKHVESKSLNGESLLENVAILYYNFGEAKKCEVCGRKLQFKTFTFPYKRTCGVKCVGKLDRQNYDSFIKTLNSTKKVKVKELNDWLSNPHRLENGIRETNITALTISKIFANKNFYFNILFDTKDILPLPKSFTNITDLELPRRHYHLQNNIIDVPKCEFCGNPARFYNSVRGYSNTCIGNVECERERNRLKRRETTQAKIEQQLTDYELVEDYVDRHTNILIKCKRCEEIFYLNCWNGSHVKTNKKCPKCYPWKFRSKEEEEVCEFLRGRGLEIVCNDKTILGKGKDLDIYIPSKKIGIEYNGVRWHSENFGTKSRTYHQKKLELANENGVQLIQVQSNEWSLKKDIIKSILLSKLGMYDRKIFARKCVVKEINSASKNKFLEENHIQGADKSKYKLGLYLGEELVSVMTFGKRKITKGDIKLELIRFCSLKYTQVVGGASKLLKHFLRNNEVKELITYADRRFSDGKFYEKLGFDLSHISQPNYYYFKHEYKMYHRSYFMKHKMINILEKFDSNKTEWENAKDNGYDRIWDCGHFVYKLTLQQ